MSYPTSQGSLHIGTCPCDGCNPREPDREELAREREMNLNQDFSCQDCGLNFTADTEDGEWPDCVLCSSPNVTRKALT